MGRCAPDAENATHRVRPNLPSQEAEHGLTAEEKSKARISASSAHSAVRNKACQANIVAETFNTNMVQADTGD